MTAKQRFELAIAGYKDVSEQLRRWEAFQLAKGVPVATARRAAGQRLAAFDLFALHKAFFDLGKASTDADEVFEREIEEFETNIRLLKDQLSLDGVPIA